MNTTLFTLDFNGWGLFLTFIILNAIFWCGHYINSFDYRTEGTKLRVLSFAIFTLFGWIQTLLCIFGKPLLWLLRQWREYVWYDAVFTWRFYVSRQFDKWVADKDKDLLWKWNELADRWNKKKKDSHEKSRVLRHVRAINERYGYDHKKEKMQRLTHAEATAN